MAAEFLLWDFDDCTITITYLIQDAVQLYDTFSALLESF